MSNEEFIAFVRKNWISVACVIASIAIGVVIYLRADELPEAEKVLAEKAKQGALLRANIEDSKQIKEQHAAIIAANQEIAGRMIRVGQLAENLQYFYRLESDTGTKLTDPGQVPWSPPPKSAPRTTYTPVGFHFTAQGEYPQVVDLLRKLENGEHYCRIITCNIHPVVELRGGPDTMQLTLELMGIP